MPKECPKLPRFFLGILVRNRNKCLINSSSARSFLKYTALSSKSNQIAKHVWYHWEENWIIFQVGCMELHRLSFWSSQNLRSSEVGLSHPKLTLKGFVMCNCFNFFSISCVQQFSHILVMIKCVYNLIWKFYMVFHHWKEDPFLSAAFFLLYPHCLEVPDE